MISNAFHLIFTQLSLTDEQFPVDEELGRGSLTTSVSDLATEARHIAQVSIEGNFTQLEKSRSSPMQYVPFYLLSSIVIMVSIKIIQSFLSRVDELNKLAGSQCLGLQSSAGRVLQRERRGHEFESH